MLRGIVLDRVLLQQIAEAFGLHSLIGMHRAVSQVRQTEQCRQSKDRDCKATPAGDYFFLN